MNEDWLKRVGMRLCVW